MKPVRQGPKILWPLMRIGFSPSNAQRSSETIKITQQGWRSTNKMKKINLLGQTFGRLKVLREGGTKGGQKLWWCKCECGIEKEVAGGSLRNGQKSCGCTRYIRPYESLYNYCMFHAVREHPELQHTLTYEEFLLFVHEPSCHYCGATVAFVHRNINGLRAIRYNLDRKNNVLGYCKDNLAVCCKRCNYAKGNRFTYEEFIQIGNVIRSFQ